MVSNFLLARWFKAVKHLFLLMVVKKGVLLTKKSYAVKYISLFSFARSSVTCNRSPDTEIGVFLVVFPFKAMTLFPHMM